MYTDTNVTIPGAKFPKHWFNNRYNYKMTDLHIILGRSVVAGTLFLAVNILSYFSLGQTIAFETSFKKFLLSMINKLIDLTYKLV